MAVSFVFRHLNENERNLCTSLITQNRAFEETNEFTIPGTEVVVKLRPADNVTVPDDSLAVQVILVQPHNDIIRVTGDQASRTGLVLRSNSKSYVMTRKTESIMIAAGYPARRVRVVLAPTSSWRKSFLNLIPDQPIDVTIEAEGREIGTTEAILCAESDVFKAMFAYETKERKSRVVQIEDFSSLVVQEMIRFLMHDYCSEWDGHCEQLTNIADKYNISGMQKLAKEKKALLDAHP